MVFGIHGTTEEFLKRISMLENFKANKVWTMSMKVPYKKLLQTDRYLVKNPEAPKSSDQPDNSPGPRLANPNEHAVDEGTPKEQWNYGPNKNGEWFTQEQAEQMNMALMIRTLDFDYFKEKLFNMNSFEVKTLQYNYSLYKHVFFWLLECWNPNDEDVDNVICTLLEKMHQENQLFYHWSWYVFPRVLDFYQHPKQKLRFLFKCAVSVNDTDHAWNNLPDHPAKISLGRRPRPILHLLYRTALFNKFDHKAWEELATRMKLREQTEPGFCEKFWASFKMELIEARTSSLWEDAGRGFETEPKIATWKNMTWNLPLHVFMNPPVKFLPYFAKAIWKVFDEVPKIVFTALELQCYYCTRHSKTVRVIENIFIHYLASLGPNDKRPFDERKIRILKQVCRSQRRTL